MDGLVGLFGPPTMPKELRERIAADIRTVMDADPLINDRLITTAQVPNPGGPAQFAKSIDEQRAVLTRAAKDLGIAPK
jgi:tripartite-type tricarboxylate transporter receptor subunit TctC